jgi:uncharacterized protein YcfJ
MTIFANRRFLTDSFLPSRVQGQSGGRRQQILIAVVTVFALAGSATLGAQGYESGDLGPEEAVSFGFADVLRSDPIFETVQEASPREVCADVSTERSRRYDNTNTGTIVGAIVGAALGNQVGGGDGRRAATVAGAVVGGAVGREVDASDNPQGVERSVHSECQVVDRYVERKQVVGYDVQYRYRGEVYSSRMDYDPGEKLRVRVAISPAE